MEPLLAFLLQRPALVSGVDSSSDPYPLLCCHVHVLELALLDGEGRLGAAAAALPAVRLAAQALRGTPAAPAAPHASWAQADALLRVVALLEVSLTPTLALALALTLTLALSLTPSRCCSMCSTRTSTSTPCTRRTPG